MDLIYYYPFVQERRKNSPGAPITVARNVFRYIVKKEKELPFENLKLFVPSKYVKEIPEQFSDFEVITYRNLNSASKNSVIHIHVSPLIFPNSKFLLHLFGILKRKKLILRLAGDIRTEMQIRFKYEHSLNISNIPTYIAMPYLLNSADKLIVHSYVMSNLVKCKYGVNNIVVIPNGIEDSWFDKSDVTNIELDGDPNLFYHGRLSPVKGVDLLIKGFAKATGNHSKARLYIAAGGPQRGYKDLCMKLGIEKNVVFLGRIGRKDVKSYLSNAEAAIYPSTYEPFSLAILEAFSSINGPVYYSSFAGINDFAIRDGYSLNAFEPTVENISEIIKDIIEGNYDIQVVRQQKEFARRYTWDKVINDYIKLYNSIY